MRKFTILFTLFVLLFAFSSYAENAKELTQTWYADVPRISENALDVLAAHDANVLSSEMESYALTRAGSFSDTISFASGEEQLRKIKLKEMEARLNQNIIYAETTAFIQDAAYVEEGILLTVYEWTFCDYDDLSDTTYFVDTMGFGTEHKMLFARENGQLVLVKDAYDEGALTGMRSSCFYEFYDESVEEAQSRLSLINTEEAEDDRQLMYTRFEGYNTDAVAAYADTYWSNYNPAYPSYANSGGDCANFTSQSIHAGGMPTDGSWYSGAYAWINAGGLRTYMSNARGERMDGPWDAHIYKGSPVFYDWTSDGIIDHATICVGFNAAGTPVIDSHTANKYRVNWNYGYSNTSYSTVKLTERQDGTNVVITDNCASSISFYDGCSIESLYIDGWMATSRFHFRHATLHLRCVETGEVMSFHPDAFTPVPGDASAIMATVPNSISCCRFTFRLPRNTTERFMLNAGHHYTVWVDAWDENYTIGHRLTLLDSNAQYGPTEMTFTYHPSDESSISAFYKDGDTVTGLNASGWFTSGLFRPTHGYLWVKDTVTGIQKKFPLNYNVVPQDAAAIMALTPSLGCARWDITWPQSPEDTTWMIKGRTYEVWIDHWNDDQSAGTRNRMFDADGNDHTDHVTVIWNGTSGPLVSTPSSSIYTGKAQFPTIQVTGPTEYTISYGTSENYGYTATNTGALESLAMTNVGTTTVYYKIEAENHETITGSFPYTIEKAVGALILSKDSVTLSGEPSDCTISAVGTISAASANNSVCSAIYIDGKLIIVPGREVGNTTITVHATATDNTTEATQTITVTNRVAAPQETLSIIPVTEEASSGKSTFSAVIKNNEATAHNNNRVSVAAYDADGRFIGMTKLDVSVGANDLSEFSGEIPVTAHSLAYFVWQNNTMKPLGTAKRRNLH